ncbi:rod-binding protein [Hyphobacterium sp. SN044]|uniref:rod-binding protein n=1 Tax=Hyphobacterium sp. SN044 TaxID=2912575 RepID=UPI001F33E452|nr:rod-binding protein [Hyphobacterium sp. SN044]MCF8878491.1 rod-binding protein [Hyphobacterium sp. SN044]
MPSADAQLAQVLAGRGGGRAPEMRQVANEAEARQVAEEFEAFFLSQILEQMFTGVGENNPFGGGSGEQAFRGLLNEEYAKVMARAGGLGLSDNLTTEILRYQEAGGDA